ncbi:MAG: polysulfide reductase NrfD [Desulfobacteraceae bacterium]|jgi:Ni/Fe-hydrogenase subunit HybB-like protein|nr:polysulfide reductase NrfD [Desulfobacteraceae bacterium]
MSQPMQPVKTVMTPFNIISGIIILIGVVLTILRFSKGIGAVTNLDDSNPWGIWIGFDLLCGVALAAGGYVTCATCYIFGLKHFKVAVRPAILTAFLGYALVVVALSYDVGRPWRLPYPIFFSQGTSSILFEVALCVMLYLSVLFFEFIPAAFEWLGWKHAHNIIGKFSLVLVIFGIILSTLHQSSLGALFLIAPSKLHPLWHSGYLAVYFFISSIFAGMSMVIFEHMVVDRFLHDKIDEEHDIQSNNVALGFGKAAAFLMAGYLMIQVIGIAIDNDWKYLGTRWGLWYLFEMIGFVGLPAVVYGIGVRENNIRLIQWTSFWVVIGVVLNRLNISIVAFNWQLPMELRYFPSWMEIMTTVFIITVGIVLFKFIATRMPILHEHPDYPDDH